MNWYDIVRVVPQGLILGPFLFNLFINDLFLFIERTNICNFADDNAIYNCQNDLKTILARHLLERQGMRAVKKGHILVNLGQFEDEPPLNSTKI